LELLLGGLLGRWRRRRLLLWLLGLLLKLLRRGARLHVCRESYSAESTVIHIILHG
jgi:hypothetical protein